MNPKLKMTTPSTSPTPSHTTDWKLDGVRVVPGDQLDGSVPSTPGMDRKAAINFARVGAQKLWAGTVHIHPDAKTGAHHHGPLESVIYVVKGRARMRWGERAPPRNQRQPHRDARMRPLPQRRPSDSGEFGHRAD
jgi:uncharacterized RmlC-like cupin family protein